MSLHSQAAGGFAASRDGAPSCPAARPDAGAVRACRELVPLAGVPDQAWAQLAAHAVEPNAFYLPEWARAVAAHVRRKPAVSALLVWDGPSRQRLIGMAPVESAWQALRLPLPVLVGWEAYAPLATPLLDCEACDAAAAGLLGAAAEAGAAALMFRGLPDEGACAQALRRAAERFGAPLAMAQHDRAALDATQDAADLLRDALGAKKLKELRRQRHRLADQGAVAFAVARDPDEVVRAVDGFLSLEDSGWKGVRGTALARDASHAAFVREAMQRLAAAGMAEVATLRRGAQPVAAALIVRHGGRAFYFKIAHDETAARLSPGVQLTLDVTQHLCADPGIADADSIAVADHPMIDRVWRGRLGIADLLVPTGSGAAVFRAIASVMTARHAARDAARRLGHAVRSRSRTA